MDKLQVAYCDEVLRFRKVLNLTSVKELSVFYETFITSSLALNPWIKDGDILLDVGSGMGVPGIPLLIHRPDIKGILVERRKKRAEFLRHVVRKLKLNADVYDADINDLPPLFATICTARAVSEVKTLIGMCDKHMVLSARAVLPVPDNRPIPLVDGWALVDDVSQSNTQRIVCLKKSVMDAVGGVSRET